MSQVEVRQLQGQHLAARRVLVGDQVEHVVGSDGAGHHMIGEVRHLGDVAAGADDVRLDLTAIAVGDRDQHRVRVLPCVERDLRDPGNRGLQARLPPAVGYCARGTASPVSRPLATSNTCTVPCSLPFLDSETASISRPCRRSQGAPASRLSHCRERRTNRMALRRICIVKSRRRRWT